MLSDLHLRFDAIERQRATLQSGALALSDGQLVWTPDDTHWSVGQIVQHLVLSDETVGRALDADRVEPEALMFRVLPRAWRRALVLSALKRDSALPLPSPAVEPVGNVPLSRLLERWETMRREMRGVLEAMQANEKRYRHPVLGPLTAAQMLELSQTHMAYHARQMKALQRQAAFPTE